MRRQTRELRLVEAPVTTPGAREQHAGFFERLTTGGDVQCQCRLARNRPTVETEHALVKLVAPRRGRATDDVRRTVLVFHPTARKDPEAGHE